MTIRIQHAGAGLLDDDAVYDRGERHACAVAPAVQRCYARERPPLAPEIFDKAFAEAVVSEWTRRVIGGDVPDGVDPYSFITTSGLNEIASTFAA